MKEDALNMTKVLGEQFPQLLASDDLQYVELQALNAAWFYPIRSLTAITNLRKNTDYGDFIYWKRLEAITFNVFGNGSSHELMMGNLYTLEMLDKHKLKNYDAAEDFVMKKFDKRLAAIAHEDASEAFIMEGYGAYMSSVGSSIKMGPDFSMTFTEKTAFRGYNISRL
jgi:hypothetical protein